MGVPKFFRYISERYPCLSEYVKEYQIPEFDHLYLDMNGIIHMCSHPDDGIHFRIAEEKIFQDIFHYIEILFCMIKPQRLFFMAIDGVAPRAKMNQQRGRRFRSAKEAEQAEAKARQQGEALPDEARFDSNCITPGTVFMAKLQEQLKYFIVNKITNDKLWRKCKIVLSGHETPGEGEHKIMDYIRYMRAQPGYDPSTRHCLYGLDADLIMLGLCTHEPHFSLLREEVQFGKKSTKRKSVPEQINFFLLHLSLMREYLEQEFISLKGKLPFEYNMENIIDDWVLMGFLVGNDFIPHLPNLHIANGALPMLYDAYMKVLPELEGYINEGGRLNLERFEKFMQVLCSVDMDHFSETYADLKYFESKTGRRPDDKERTSYKPRNLEEWKADEDDEDFGFIGALQPEKPINPDLAKLIQQTNDMCLGRSEPNLNDLTTDDFCYEDANSYCGSMGDDDDDRMLKQEFKLHKRDYYMNKLDYKEVTSEVMRSQAECYVRAIQWNLNYYYNGVCSWGWYYPHHYAPFISDIKDFKDLRLEYELGKPFRPYEQLLAVLPTASKTLLPEVYHGLMIEEASSIKDYYPVDFQTDLNGKKQDWEAVVLLPFIDEEKLLNAMAPCNLRLTQEEIRRNTHGSMLMFEYVDKDMGNYEPPEFFPIIKNHNARWQSITNESVLIDDDKLIKGAYPGVKMDVYYPGFPTMKHLNYKSELDKAKVKVFDQPSRGENMILTILPPEEDKTVEELATQLLGQVVLVGWPHLIEAKVVTISTKNFKYHMTDDRGEYRVEEMRGNLAENYCLEKRGIIDHYRNRLGIEVGETKILVHVHLMIGRKYVFTPHGRVNLEKQWAPMPSVYPYQTIVRDITVHSKDYTAYKDIQDVYSIDSTCFMLGNPHYGCAGTVLDSKETLQKGRVKVSLGITEEPSFATIRTFEKKQRTHYMQSFIACQRVGISGSLFSRLTGIILVVLGKNKDHFDDNSNRINIGLNMKYNKRNEEVPGYTKKEKSWTYSEKTIRVVEEYIGRYPRVIQFLNKNLRCDAFCDDEIFPEDGGTGKTVKEISEWVKKLPYNSIERQTCGSTLLDPEVVKELETLIERHTEKVKTKNITMQVRPHKLYKPDIQMGNLAPDPTTTYNLYDRVINVRESYTVPLGYTGTIIAIHPAPMDKPEDVMYDILFDKPFVGGLALNCSPNRGYQMSRISLINKSHGIREFESVTGKGGELLQRLSAQQNTSQQQQQMGFHNHQSLNSAFARTNLNQQPVYKANQYGDLFAKASETIPSIDNASKKNSNAYSSPKHSPTKILDKKKDFMPAFSSERPKQEINVLKQMLKIDQPKRAGNVVGQQLSVQDIFAHASALQQAPALKSPSKSHCVQLLEFYQMHGCGIPHYTYFKIPDGTLNAQLELPFTRESVFGKPAVSKEAASECVAKAVLDKLNPNLPPPVNIKFPEPPKQWVEHKMSPNKPLRNLQPLEAIESKQLQTSNQNYKPNSQPFVPLQAVKQHRRSESSNDALGNKNPKNAENKNESNRHESTSKSDHKGGSDKNQGKPKPRRERKMRIAANFSAAPKH